QQALTAGYPATLPPNVSLVLGLAAGGKSVPVKQLVTRAEQKVRTFNVSVAHHRDMVIFSVDEGTRATVAYLLAPGGNLRRAARPSAPPAAEAPQRPPAEGGSLERSSLDYWLLSKLRSLLGNPPVEFVVRSGTRVGPAGATAVARVSFASRATLTAVLADPWLRFGDAYADGRVTIEGDLVGLLETVYHASGMGGGKRASLLRRAGGALRRRHLNSFAASRDNIHHHYDIGNDFYAL